MKRVLLVAGARPNFMKIAPLVRALGERANGFRPTLVHTGQHYDDDMSEVFFAQLGLPRPHVHLDAGSGTHGTQTARVLAAFEEYLLSIEPPAGIVVVGDVNSTMACALAAVKLRIPVAHVEAGLRSFDRSMPEEINRVVTDAVSDLLLVSEPSGMRNLEQEGIPVERRRYVGNVMIDTLVHELEAARALQVPERLGLRERAFALVTLHRPSNVDDPARLEAIVSFLRQTAAEIPVLFPLHPRTRGRLEEYGLMAGAHAHPGLRLLDPLGYRETLSLMEASRFVLTDSGGIQEETTYLGIPCLTVRPNTERPVTVTDGTNTVIGDDLGRAAGLVRNVLEGRYKTGRPIPGWDGQAGRRVVDALAEAWS